MSTLSIDDNQMRKTEMNKNSNNNKDNINVNLDKDVFNSKNEKIENISKIKSEEFSLKNENLDIDNSLYSASTHNSDSLMFNLSASIVPSEVENQARNIVKNNEKIENFKNENGNENEKNVDDKGALKWLPGRASLEMVYMHICMRVCMYVCIYVYEHVYMYMNKFICIYIHTLKCIYVCMYINIHPYEYTHIHIYSLI
jgi:hypothetical protein